MTDSPSLDAVSSHVDLIVRLQESVRTLFASFLSFGVLMLISFWHLPQWVQIIAVVGCVACGSVLVVLLGDFLRIRWFRLHQLAGDEKKTLLAFVQNNRRTVHWLAGDDGPMSLFAEGILLPAKRAAALSSNDEGYAWYTIRPWVFNYLSKRRDLIDPPNSAASS
jgi:hypothetical protein